MFLDLNVRMLISYDILRIDTSYAAILKLVKSNKSLRRVIADLDKCNMGVVFPSGNKLMSTVVISC